MTTVTDRPAELITDYWMAALRLASQGRHTAALLNAMAADPEWVRGESLMCGITEDQERDLLLGIAAAMGQIEAQGMTPEACFNLAGLDLELGPYISPAAARYTAACHMYVGWTSETIPETTRPEVQDALAALEGEGYTAETAMDVIATGNAPVPSPRTAPDGAPVAA